MNGNKTDLTKDDFDAVSVTINGDKGALFILFDANNRIISFAAWNTGYYITLLKF